MIMDGFGLAAKTNGNAITGNTPNIDRLMEKYATTTLNASGLEVGLPEGQMGNSEVGHLNLGAGRVVYQDITRIDKSILDGDFFDNKAFLCAINNAKQNNSALHLIGLCSDGGVHSHLNHLYALLELCKKQKFDKVLIHCITDGRDTPPKSAAEYIKQLEQKCAEIGVGRIATVSGRYYAMDRDNRWDRVEVAYNCIIKWEGVQNPDAVTAIERSYANGKTDEFIQPAKIGRYGMIEPKDSVIFFNFRADRARELSQIITERNKDITFVTITEYDQNLTGVQIAFPPKDIRNTLGEVLSKNGLNQVRLAETEKYAHVTYFFNGGIEKPFDGEDRILVPSPKVATYDLTPRMSADELTTRALECVGKYDVIIINFANCDMVGHTGIFDAAVKAVQTVDECVGKLVDSILLNGGTAMITADHGNAEKMLADDNSPFTAHTTNKVPLILVSEKIKQKLNLGSLCDVAPTMLKILNLEQPKDMDGKSLY